jgi:hypothetical protein
MPVPFPLLFSFQWIAIKKDAVIRLMHQKEACRITSSPAMKQASSGTTGIRTYLSGTKDAIRD